MSLYNAYVLYKLRNYNLLSSESTLLSRYLRSTLGKLTGQHPAVLWIILLILLVRVHSKFLYKIIILHISRHFPSPVPETPGKGKKTRRRCHACATTTQPGRTRRRQETKFMCADCNVALCVYSCFIRYMHINTFVCVLT